MKNKFHFFVKPSLHSRQNTICLLILCKRVAERIHYWVLVRARVSLVCIRIHICNIIICNRKTLCVRDDCG